MKIKMNLLTDTIFGNGSSIPGAEDIAVLCDQYGFPYFKGSTFKGIFREELERYFELSGKKKEEIPGLIQKYLGAADHDGTDSKLVFSDFTIHDAVKKTIIGETGSADPEMVKGILTNVRTFTKIEENGIVSKGSLRSARCVNKGVTLYSEIQCQQDDCNIVEEVLPMIKWVGTMRNRGFGKVKITIV